MWGKLLGACFGFMFGKFLGALLGLFVGHMFDRSLKQDFDRAGGFVAFLTTKMYPSAKPVFSLVALLSWGTLRVQRSRQRDAYSCSHTVYG